MKIEQPVICPRDEVASRGRNAGRRPPIAFVASVVAHVLILAALVFLLPQVERPQHEWVLAYLVDLGDSGSPGMGAGSDAAGSHSAPAHAVALAAMPQKPPHAHRRAAHPQAPPARASQLPFAVFGAVPASADDAPKTARSAEAVPPAAGTAISGISVASTTSFGDGTGAGGAGAGGRGSGGFGDGSGASFAHVQYGHNPAPIYPAEARRLAEHGTVLLRIKVAVDGAVEMVEVAQSSGFDLLDDEALETVRTRWRFVPARRDGVAVESWCEVPIRFALTEAQAN